MYYVTFSILHVIIYYIILSKGGKSWKHFVAYIMYS